MKGSGRRGHFPFGRRWSEWNGLYRDQVRRFWRGDPGLTGALASRLCGSADLYENFAGDRTLGQALLEPTRIYVKPVLALMQKVAVKGLAHITGGCLTENIPRVLPPTTCARLEAGTWPRPATTSASRISVCRS